MLAAHLNVNKRQIAEIGVDNTELMARVAFEFVLIAVDCAHGTGFVKQSMAPRSVLVADHCQVHIRIGRCITEISRFHFDLVVELVRSRFALVFWIFLQKKKNNKNQIKFDAQTFTPCYTLDGSAQTSFHNSPASADR
jgi:hypothetical protein